ncbi:hypothetical protein CY34DRAFT_327408 [Suillus luteus UH-Slu-Lm8-n1]|uniref:Uncharacterized protein n=1 Tax=Suillus luteus UH-Slu-Lm8-n1 TaxID=930992 RepID=A0A0D0ANJ4_9AGAM|nr:hypothetical protein CY34DRAFT_327408 [Suillus luteus UH-Slu-Lm8-n1]
MRQTSTSGFFAIGRTHSLPLRNGRDTTVSSKPPASDSTETVAQTTRLIPEPSYEQYSHSRDLVLATTWARFGRQLFLPGITCSQSQLWADSENLCILCFIPFLNHSVHLRLPAR